LRATLAKSAATQPWLGSSRLVQLGGSSSSSPLRRHSILLVRPRDLGREDGEAERRCSLRSSATSRCRRPQASSRAAAPPAVSRGRGGRGEPPPPPRIGFGRESGRLRDCGRIEIGFGWALGFASSHERPCPTETHHVHLPREPAATRDSPKAHPR
jgi:hypothetical protein